MEDTTSLRPYLTTRQGPVVCCGKPPREHCVVEYRREKEIEFICYDRWLPNVRLLAPHIPDNILLDYIRRGCIEFARQSKILTRNITLLTQKNVADYWPCLGPNERIEWVRLLSVNGECFEPQRHSCSWGIGPSKYWFHPPSSLEIHPPPNECAKIIFTVDACPSEDSIEVDRLIHDRYFKAIEDYAVALASLIPPRDDSHNAVRASGDTYTLFMRGFNKSVTRAKIDQAQNFSDATTLWLGGGCSGM